jgi:hypothetical protein
MVRGAVGRLVQPFAIYDHEFELELCGAVTPRPLSPKGREGNKFGAQHPRLFGGEGVLCAVNRWRVPQ